MSVDTAVILCGGRGSRFRESARTERAALRAARDYKPYPRPRTSLDFESVERLCDTPKFLAPVCGKPVLWHKIDQLSRAGVQNVILCAGTNTAVTRESLCRLSWDDPPTLSFTPRSLFGLDDLGYVGRALKGRPADSNVFITAADCLTTTDYTRLATEHTQKKWVHNRSLSVNRWSRDIRSRLGRERKVHSLGASRDASQYIAVPSQLPAQRRYLPRVG